MMAAPFITPRTPNTAKSVVKFTGLAFVNPAHNIQLYTRVLDCHQLPAGQQVTHLAPQIYGWLMADRTKYRVKHRSSSATWRKDCQHMDGPTRDNHKKDADKFGACQHQVQSG